MSLLFLLTGHIVQTISKVELNKIKDLNSLKIKIYITEKLKTPSYNREQQILEFNTFTQYLELCVPSTLKAYLTKTSTLRKDNKGYLILTFKKPHHAVISQSISRWIRQILNGCVVGMNLYHTHNIRHATSSAAFRKGFTIDQIKIL